MYLKTKLARNLMPILLVFKNASRTRLVTTRMSKICFSNQGFLGLSQRRGGAKINMMKENDTSDIPRALVGTKIDKSSERLVTFENA